MEIKPPSWNWTTHWNTPSYNLTRLQDAASLMLLEELPITSCKSFSYYQQQPWWRLLHSKCHRRLLLQQHLLYNFFFLFFNYYLHSPLLPKTTLQTYIYCSKFFLKKFFGTVSGFPAFKKIIEFFRRKKMLILLQLLLFSKGTDL